MTDINPCAYCQGEPESGFYPGDFAIECPSCLLSISRHMIDFPANNDFDESADLAKAAAIKAWNKQNLKG